MGIAYIFHVRGEALKPWPFSLAIILAVTLATEWHFQSQPRDPRARDIYHPNLRTMTLAGWQGGGWRTLPKARSELDGDAREAFLLQWAGRGEVIRETLQGLGWAIPQPWDAKNTLSWLLPKMSIQDLPVLPKLNQGEASGMTFTKVTNSTTRIVIRLWKERELTDAGASAQPLWIGMVTTEKLRRVGGFLTLAVTDSNFVAPLNVLRSDLRDRHSGPACQTCSDSAVLLVRNPPHP